MALKSDRIRCWSVRFYAHMLKLHSSKGEHAMALKPDRIRCW